MKRKGRANDSGHYQGMTALINIIIITSIIITLRGYTGSGHYQGMAALRLTVTLLCGRLHTPITSTTLSLEKKKK